jgi:hypothetical protein
MIQRSTHEADILLLILLFLKGSSLLWHVVILILLHFAFAFAMWLRLVHHVGTSLTLSSFRSSVLSPSFLLNIKRGDQVWNRHVHPLVFESSDEIPLWRRQFDNNGHSHKLVENNNLQKSEFLLYALYLMSLCNHSFPIYHLVVMVLLNDVQPGVSIWTSILSVQGISHLFSGFVANVRILQSLQVLQPPLHKRLFWLLSIPSSSQE